MHDINPHIKAIIEPVCDNIELSFPKGKSEFPLVTISEIYNSSDIVVDGEERYSGISVQIDVWDNSDTRQKCEDIACRISVEMIRAGFKRQNANPIDEDFLWRKSMTFTGIIDEKTFKVYERS